MGYLNYLPKFEYTLASLKGTVADIFRRVSFTQESRSNPQNYSEYLTEGIESPDRLSEQKLDNPEYYWQILMMNNFISEDDFPDSYREYSSHVNTLKGGTSLLFEEFFPVTPLVGDVCYEVESGGTVNFDNGGVVSEYDALLRKISMEYVFGNGFGTTGAALYGYDDSGNFVEKGKKEIKKNVTIADSVSYFYDTNNRETSPYLFPDGDGGTFSDPLATTPAENSLLYNYLNDISTSGFFVRSELQDYQDEQLEKRNIKIPPRSIADSVATEAQRLLREGTQGETTSLVGIRRVGSTRTDLI